MKRGQVVEVKRVCSVAGPSFEEAVAITGNVVMRDFDGLGRDTREPCFWARVEFEPDHWERVSDIIVRNGVS